jgi:hypothetical protein
MNIERKTTFREPDIETKERRPMRMPVSVVVKGKKEIYWPQYSITQGQIEETCPNCHRENQAVPVQTVKEVTFDYDDPEIKQSIEEKLRHIVDEVERRMSVCNDCMNAEFIEKRPRTYVDTLEQVQKEEGVELSSEQLANQRSAILGNDEPKTE